MKIYYDRQKLKNNELFCLGINLTNEDIKKLKTEGIEYVIYTGNNLFSGYPFVEGNILRQATIKESIELGYIKLQEGEIMNGDNEIVKIEKPSYQYKWDFTLQKWLPDEEKLYDGQYINGDEIITVPRLTDVINQEWDKTKHEWIDKTTNLDIVQTQYKEYEGMDTPSVIREMELQDLALAEEFVNMLIELRKLIYTLSASETQVAGYAALPIPQPSKALENFKNRFKLTK